MKSLILAAGYGTRLYPLVKDTPKALLEVNKKTLINHILDKIKTLDGLSEVIVVTNDKFYIHFEQWAQKQKGFPHRIHIVNDGTQTNEDRLGSIGDIDFVLKQENISDDLLIIGSDNLFDYNLADYLEFARQKAPEVTIGLYDIENFEEAKKFGVVQFNSSNKIISFEEKPQQPKSTLIAMCFYYLPKQSLDLVSQYLKESRKSDMAGDYIKWLLQRNDVYGFKFTWLWYDIGSVEDYREAQKKLSDGST